MLQFKKSAGAFLLSLILLLSFSGCTNAQTNEPEMQSSSQSVLSSDESSKEKNTSSQSISEEILTSSSQTEKKIATPPEYEQYQKYVEPFKYEIGFESWDDPMELDPDALAVYYISLESIGEITLPRDGPRDKEFGNPLLPAEDVEQAVQKHFDVTAEHMRKSQYYDPDTNSYWSGGIGSTADVYIIGAKQQNDLLTIYFRTQINSSLYKAAWDCKTVIQIQKNNYKYLSFEKNLIYEIES